MKIGLQMLEFHGRNAPPARLPAGEDLRKDLRVRLDLLLPGPVLAEESRQEISAEDSGRRTQDSGLRTQDSEPEKIIGDH